jgi:hypothetical protein
VPTVVRKDTGKMNIPGIARRPPDQRQRPVVKGKYWPGQGRSGLWEEVIIGWPLLRIIRRTRMNQALFYWALRS